MQENPLRGSQAHEEALFQEEFNTYCLTLSRKSSISSSSAIFESSPQNPKKINKEKPSLWLNFYIHQVQAIFAKIKGSSNFHENYKVYGDYLRRQSNHKQIKKKKNVLNQ